MSSRAVLNSSDAENACVVCFKNADIFSVGVCDHPVCYECSTRMRVLCNQLECPICRQQMDKVIFTRTVEPFAELLQKRNDKKNLVDQRYGVHFQSPSIQSRHYQLLEHECFVCRREGARPFRTFGQLKDHMRKIHELFYCDLCVDNLKIFTFERRCYTRSELATHRRKGDADNTSHRGHPLCKFCDTRFMDNDELFRHLRRDHFFCHFCDADGKHQYYSNYNELRKHFLEEHYLCEEGDCKYEKFTSVFRTDIDLKAHNAAAHSRSLSKAATRQARTLELEFTLAPRPRPPDSMSRLRNRGGRDTNNDNEGAVGYDYYRADPGGRANNNYMADLDDTNFPNPLAAENFPTLGGNDSGMPTPRTVSNVTISSRYNPLNDSNFPTLGSGNTGTSRSSAVTITSSNKFNPNSHQDFPSLGGKTLRSAPSVTISRMTGSASQPSHREGSPGTVRSTVKLNVNSKVQNGPQPPRGASKVSIHVNQKPTSMSTSISSSTNHFPSLNTEPLLQQPAKWVQPKPKKQQQEPKPGKVAPAPDLPPSSISDFPLLNRSRNGGSRKSSSITVPISGGSWVNLNSFNNETKNSKNAGESVKPPVAIKCETKTSKNKKKKGKGQEELCNGIDKLLCNGDKIEAYKEAEENRPPPGFTAANTNPPPGLNPFSVYTSNDLTFTSSSGETYAIEPQFYYPPNFTTRNQVLIEQFGKLFAGVDNIQQFKMYSDLFRTGQIPAHKYYEHCEEVMGGEFDKIFPELLALLPDVKRQRELYFVHNLHKPRRGLEVCATCGQVILSRELKGHLLNHTMDNQFPVLNKPNETNGTAWNRK